MEKIEWLIDKLKRQYDAAAGAVAMLGTLQLLQQELSLPETVVTQPKGISIMMPAPKWDMNVASEIDAYEVENLHSEDEEKMVFELDPFVEEDEQLTEGDELPTAEAAPAEEVKAYQPPAEKKMAAPEPIVMPAPEPELLKATPPVAAPPPVPAPPTPEPPPLVPAVIMPPPTVDTTPKSLNELLEKPLPDVYFRFQEPIKDLKKAISINDRFQYINNLFSGDESVFDRSIKTINNFNIYSEAEYWIRRELSVKYGWLENDPLVQQFYSLISRRFA